MAASWLGRYGIPWPIPWWFYFVRPWLTPEDEKEFLKREKEYLLRRIEEIDRRLKELGA